MAANEVLGERSIPLRSQLNKVLLGLKRERGRPARRGKGRSAGCVRGVRCLTCNTLTGGAVMCKPLYAARALAVDIGDGLLSDTHVAAVHAFGIKRQDDIALGIDCNQPAFATD